MTTLSASQTRIPAEMFSRVAYQRERICIKRRGSRPVYLVSEDDLEMLQRLEDRYWAEEGEKALAEFKRSGEKAVDWETLKAKLGL